jgi:PAS domain S-box-containing protein
MTDNLDTKQKTVQLSTSLADTAALPSMVKWSNFPIADSEPRLSVETLVEVTLALTSQSSLAVVLQEILRQAQRLAPYQTGHIVLVEEDKLRSAAWHGYQVFGSEKLISNLVQPMADFPLDAQVIQTRQPMLILDTHQEPLWTVQDETSWVRSNLMLPICLGNQVLGLLRLDADTPGAFSGDDIVSLQPLANIAAIALENARLFDQARQEISERQRVEEALQRSLMEAEMAYKQAMVYAQELNEEINERKRSDQERRQLSAAIEQTAESIIITDTKGVICYVNPAFERITGYSRDEAIQMTPRLLRSNHQNANFYKELWATIQAGQVWQGRIVNKKKDGSLYTSDTTISPVRDKTGVIVNYVAAGRDITQELKSSIVKRKKWKQLAGWPGALLTTLITY